MTALQRKLQSGSSAANVALPEAIRNATAANKAPNARRARAAEAPPSSGPGGRLRGIQEEPAGLEAEDTRPAAPKQRRSPPNMPARPEPRAQASPEFALDGGDLGPPLGGRDRPRGNDRYPSLTQQGVLPANWSGPPGEYPDDLDWPEDLSQPSTEHSGPRSDHGRPDDWGRGWSDASGSARSGSSQHGSQDGSEYAQSEGDYMYEDEQSLEDYMPPDDGGPSVPSGYRGAQQGAHAGGAPPQYRGPAGPGPGPGGPGIPSTRVVEGVGLMRADPGGGRQLGPAQQRGYEPEPPGDYEFTSFQDAQSQLRMMRSRVDDRQ